MVSSSSITWSLLKKNDDVATAACLSLLESLPDKTNCTKFVELAKSEAKDILDRDNKDAEALKRGIDFAKSKGVLPKEGPVGGIRPYLDINVMGKTAEEVAQSLLDNCGGMETVKNGCVLVLVGLSGTGKGTTVAKLKDKLESEFGKGKATAWSNGNLFRCLTILACEEIDSRFYEGKRPSDIESYKKYLEIEEGGPSNNDCILTASNLKKWSGPDHLKFEKRSDTNLWDIQLTLQSGTKHWVSEVCNTLLKEPRISKTIPIVAGKTQGEVVLFASDCCRQMGNDGTVVLVEGRQETVDFMPTEHRFCLVLKDVDSNAAPQSNGSSTTTSSTNDGTNANNSDSNCTSDLIGKRRAAQRVLALALEKCSDDDGKVSETLGECLDSICKK